VAWLVRSILWDVQVAGLIVAELCERGLDAAQMQCGDLLIELFRQEVHFARLVFAVLIVAPELDLRERLVAELLLMTNEG
jgi:hypothetical protein